MHRQGGEALSRQLSERKNVGQECPTHTSEGDQEHAGLVGILQCGAEVFGGELRTFAQFANCGFIVDVLALRFMGVLCNS